MLNNPEFSKIIDNAQKEVEAESISKFKKIREADINLHISNDEIFVKYECVLDLVKRHDKLIDKLKERK